MIESKVGSLAVILAGYVQTEKKRASIPSETLDGALFLPHFAQILLACLLHRGSLSSSDAELLYSSVSCAFLLGSCCPGWNNFLGCCIETGACLVAVVALDLAGILIC
jgi:hypothetical protein